MAKIFFDLAQSNVGDELFVSDGTAAGTHIVKDIADGGAGSRPSNFTVVGDTLFFTATDFNHITELWKTDGTADGTVMVAGFDPSSIPAPIIANVTNVNGTVFFTVDDDVHGDELWKSDGTSTQLVKDIVPGSGSSTPERLTNVNGTLFFIANDGESDGTGYALWKSDGTADGTVMVKQFAPDAVAGDIYNLTAFNGELFFVTIDGTATNTHGYELWKSDGTAAGTVLVKDIEPETNASSDPTDLTVVGNTLFFQATDGVPTDITGLHSGHGVELWSSDGTGAGLVDDINPNPAPLFDDSNPFGFTDVNGTLFFGADDGVHGFELWKSDGTEAGTVLVKDIYPGPGPFDENSGPGDSVDSLSLINVYGTLFFFADDGIHGKELWKSDGTEAGTVLVKDINPGADSSNLFGDSMIAADHVLYFDADDGSGEALWRSDGTADGTFKIADNFDNSHNGPALAVIGASDPHLFPGTPGDDFIQGTTGADTMIGGAGNDTYVVNNVGDVVTENANEGTDTVQTTLAGYALGANVENLTFTDNGAHTGNGNALDNAMTGGAGDDTLFGSGGKDVLDGGDGNDTLVGNDSGAGAFLSEGNTLNGGNGNDTLIGEVSDTVNGGAGTDSLQAENANPWTIDLGATSIETMLAGFGDDHIDGSTQTAGVTVFASGGNDTVTGSGFNDFLWGGVGNDTLTGGAGNDLLFGDLGADSLTGGDGNDTLYADNSDTHIDGGAGTDALYWAAGANANINVGADAVEFVQTLGDNDTLDGSGATTDLVLFAGAGTDTVTGGSGNDFLWGEAGDDTLVGGAGDDTIVGGTGADKLTGGAGTDNLFGGNGSNTGDGAADTFVFTAGWGTDFVYGFDDGTDKLDMTASGATQFSQLTVTSSNGNADIDFGTNHIIVVGQATHIDAGDFVF
jgi:ELWxxDGT repeat protein